MIDTLSIEFNVSSNHGYKRGRLGSGKLTNKATSEIEGIDEYHVYRVLDIIAKREYLNLGDRYYKKHNIRHSLNYDGRGKRCGYLQAGCAASAAAIKQVVGAHSTIGIHNDLVMLDKLGLLDLELYDDDNNEYNKSQIWYSKLDLTHKGVRYLEVFDNMLKLVNYFG